MDAQFYFGFTHQGVNARHRFKVELPDGLSKKESTEKIEIHLTEFDDGSNYIHDLETKYGVHDVSFSEDEVFGFTSYEIEQDKMPFIMRTWADKLESLGFKIDRDDGITVATLKEQ